MIYFRFELNVWVWRMFMTVTMESAVFMGKNYLNKCHSIVNTTDLTLKQMFDTPFRVSDVNKSAVSCGCAVGVVVVCCWCSGCLRNSCLNKMRSKE